MRKLPKMRETRKQRQLGADREFLPVVSRMENLFHFVTPFL